MEVKAVFFDIDGTLVNDRKSVLKSTKDAIKIVKRARSACWSSDRTRAVFCQGIDGRLGPRLCGDLQWPIHFNKEKVLFASPIAKSSLRQLIAYAKKERKEIALGTEHAVVGSKIMSFGLGSFFSTG